MAKTLGYMITWTTYSTWLQGDDRGFVKNGKIHTANESLEHANKQLQTQKMIKLTKAHQDIVRDAIIKEASSRNQNLYALSVQSNHVHIVAEYTPQPIGTIVAYYKRAGRVALKQVGVNGKLWTRGYDKRFCFDKQALNQKIKYVKGHNK